MSGCRRLLLLPAVLILTACIGDLPPGDFPCLVAAGLYDQYNEAYVFSPQGDRKREALARVQAAEEECQLGAEPDGG